MASPTKWTTTITALFGIWLVSAPLVLEVSLVDHWNDVLVGSVVLLTTWYNYSRERRGRRLNRRVTVFNGLLGGWLLVAPFLFDVSGLPLWNDIIVGTGVASLATYNTYAAPRIHDTKAHTHAEEM